MGGCDGGEGSGGGVGAVRDGLDIRRRARPQAELGGGWHVQSADGYH